MSIKVGNDPAFKVIYQEVKEAYEKIVKVQELD